MFNKKEYNKQYYQTNKEHLLKQQKEYRKDYYVSNRDRIRTWHKQHQSQKVQELNQIKRKEHCHICNISFIDSPEICDYHHLDRTTKDHKELTKLSKTIQAKEIAKCVPLCSNCHRMVHIGNGIGLLGCNDRHKTSRLGA